MIDRSDRSAGRVHPSDARTIIGIDVGSVSVAVCQIDLAGTRLASGYVVHHGDIRGALRQLLGAEPSGRVGWLGTTDRAGMFVSGAEPVDVHVAHIAAAERLHGRVGAILVLGGERFSLIRFDAAGRYRGTRTNGSCAAGTGSFLDQHARTLGLGGAADLSRAALGSVGVAPPIASRCAVFAKTDLIHAQQQGYDRSAICDGLCDGLAAIVADAVQAGEALISPVVLSGGVALNDAVRGHLRRRLDADCITDPEPHLHAALGCALVVRDRLLAAERRLHAPLAEIELGAERPVERMVADVSHRITHHAPLSEPSSAYPDFEDHERYELHPTGSARGIPVEVDAYDAGGPEQGELGVIVGLDVGSTSTKAVLVDADRRVRVGVYTRTAGEPVVAIQALFEALDDWSRRAGRSLRVVGASATGAGRKIAGAIVGADLVVDEVSAHARAAYELCHDTDTVIEIGGQDSKFTTLREGQVTAAIMNTVCAAGTGSFIEEQARALGCSLDDYARQVLGVAAPLASDRCTVFMQRDVNHLLASGYTVPQVLATVLHSVRENYLHRVAREASIGTNVCFQGATAKNRALVAAFEQRLGRPIRVSRYCHLTGALGAALLVADEGCAFSGFRGFGIARERIALDTKRCEHCRNRCAITVANVAGHTVACGFRCDRDLETDRYVSANRSGFELGRARRRAEQRSRERTPARHSPPPRPKGRRGPTIGIPAALQLYEQVPFWRCFFQELGATVVTSESTPSPASRGKRLAEAAFCAPMTAFHAHVADLAERVDYVFLPTLLESTRPSDEPRRQYCYYCQFASSLGATMAGGSLASRCIRPTLADARRAPRIEALFDSLRPVLGSHLTRRSVGRALATAHAHADRFLAELRRTMADEFDRDPGLAVVLIGRPYSCLPATMNKGIVDILSSLGVRVFFQDMLEPRASDVAEADELLRTVHWHYGAQILTAACAVANAPNLYAIVITSFKCAPDSTLVDTTRRIFDRHDKPYLVLELDEHDSAIGYETRIEAGLRAFRNHFARRPQRAPEPSLPLPRAVRSNPIDGRTLWLPRWDDLACQLLAASLNHRGVPTRILEDGPETTTRSMRLNTGQCIPLTIIAQGFIDAVQTHGLDPANAALWCIDSRISCHLGMFPSGIRALLDEHGRGFERAALYAGDLSFADLTLRGAMDTYFAYLGAGYLRRLACRTRPYERRAGASDEALRAGLETFRRALVGDRSKLGAVRDVVDRFAAIDVGPRDRPRVAIFGDLYTRDNDVQNQGLVRFIEQHGGEVITTPYTEYMKVVARGYFRKWQREGRWKAATLNRALLSAALVMERKLVRELERVLGPLPAPAAVDATVAALAPYGVTLQHTGESYDNLLKIASILRHDPDVRLFVQASPAFCCPSLVSEAMAGRIEQVTGVPVVTVTYDGTHGPKNDPIVPYLELAQRSARRAVPPRV